MVEHPLHLHGIAAFRTALDDKLDLAAFVHAELSALPALEVPWAPDLSTVVFCCRDLTGADPRDDATLALMDAVNAEQRVRLSSTQIAGRHHVRISVLNHRTDRARVEEAVDAIRRHSGGSPVSSR